MGYEMARQLLCLGATVIIAAREYIHGEKLIGKDFDQWLKEREIVFES